MRAAPDLSNPGSVILPQRFPLLRRISVVVPGSISLLFVALIGSRITTWQGALLLGLAAGLIVFGLRELWCLCLTVAADGLRLEGCFIRHRAVIADVHADLMGYAEDDLLTRRGLGFATGFAIPGFAYHVFAEPGLRKVVLIRTSERLLQISTREFDLVIGIHDAPRVMAAIHTAVNAARANPEKRDGPAG